MPVLRVGQATAAQVMVVGNDVPLPHVGAEDDAGAKPGMHCAVVGCELLDGQLPELLTLLTVMVPPLEEVVVVAEVAGKMQLPFRSVM